VTDPTANHEAAPELVETDLTVISGNPDAEDLAALTAVLAEVLDELAAEQGRRAAAATSAWARSQRGVNAAAHPGPGVWRSFSG
jgi:aryl-alcohol dehydrogenase-like predicted oxidoreductase